MPLPVNAIHRQGHFAYLYNNAKTSVIRINIIKNEHTIPIAFNSLPLISSLLQLLSAGTFLL